MTILHVLLILLVTMLVELLQINSIRPYYIVIHLLFQLSLCEKAVDAIKNETGSNYRAGRSFQYLCM